MIMILDVDVTAEGGIIKLIARRAIHNPRAKGPSNLRTLRPIGPVHLKNLFPQPFCTTLLHNLRHPPRLFVPKGRKKPLNPAAKRPLIKELL